jgi:hypothetical protein
MDVGAAEESSAVLVLVLLPDLLGSLLRSLAFKKKASEH